jgi:transcriptional regulator with XRE-family HTH domain
MGDGAVNSALARLARRERARADLTQEEVAEYAQISVRTIRDLERGAVGRPRRDTLERLARGLGLAGRAADEFVAAGRSWTDDEVEETTMSEGTPLAQLPLDTRGFSGRRAELAHLDAVAAGPELATRAALTVITGPPGVGKTALAVHWAHRVQRRFPDGQLFISLEGPDPLPGVLAALDVAPERIPDNTPARAALYRSRLAGRRMVIVLDGAPDAAAVRPLLPATPSCAVVVTARPRLVDLVAVDGARPLPLRRLSDSDARDLLVARLGAERLAAEPQAATVLVARCAGLPSALTRVAAEAEFDPDRPLSHLTGRVPGQARAG